MSEEKVKRSVFDNPLLSTKIKSAKAKIFPEGGLGYFIGPTLALLSNSILSAYLNKYMTDVLNMSLWAKDFVTLLPVISVIFVILGNILVGRLMDHSRSKAGKARPLLLVAAPLAIIALLMIFIITPFNTAQTDSSIWTLICFALGYNLWFAVAYPFYYTPHSSLVTLSTRNGKDRSLLATISNATALAAMGLSSMILPFFLGLLFVQKEDGTLNAEASYNNWKIFVIALMVITLLGILIEYYFTRERITEESFSLKKDETSQKKAVPLSKQAKICLKDKYWWIIIGFFFLYQLGGMLKNVSQIYYCQSWFPDADGNYTTAAGGTWQGTLSIIGAIPTALGMLAVWPLANKIGKGKAILSGAVLSVIGGIIGFIKPDNFAVVTTSFFIKALGSTPAMYISLALLADMLDHEEALTGVRTDGLTMTVYGAIMAGMTGIATGIINGLLGLAGYDGQNLNVNLEAVQNVTKWTFIGGETICYALIVLLFIFMNVEKFSKLDHETIIADQKEKVEKEGGVFIAPEEMLKIEEKEAEELSRKEEIKELQQRCEKKGLNFEEQLKIFEDKEKEAYDKALAKKKEAEEKKLAKQKEIEAKRQAKLDSMSPEEKAKYDEELLNKQKKEKAKEEKILKEFTILRNKYKEIRETN